jgi:glycosyltransferase involved in cell wall biosynthesis
VVYPYFAHYRLPVLRALAEGASDMQFEFFSGETTDLPSLKTIKSDLANLPVDQGGLPWTRLRNYWFSYFALWQSGVVRLALRRDFDALVFLGDRRFLSTWVGGLLARLTGKKVFFWTHGFLRDRTGIGATMIHTFYAIPHAILLYGHRSRKLMLEMGYSADRLRVIYNSLDYESQKKLREVAEAEQPASYRRQFQHPDLPLLVYSGRLVKRKRVDLLMLAVAKLRDTRTPVNLVVVGDGPKRDALVSLCRELRLDGHVLWRGACYDETELARLWLDAAIAVCPGDVGLNAMHAMAYGAPVLTHDGDSHGPEVEAVVPGRTGGFFRQGDADDLARAVACWLSGSSTAAEIGAACIAQIEARYTPHVQRQLIVSAIQEKLGC